MSAEVSVRRGEEAAALHREWLAPDGTTLWVDLVYRLLLGRPAEPDALLGSWRTLVAEPGSRRALAREIVASREFAEAALVEQLVGDVASGRDWVEGLAGHPDTTERVVEIPWVLSKLQRERRVLDVGTRHAFDAYATGLVRLAEPGAVVGLDLVMEPTRGVAGVAGDACVLPFASRSFSFVSCISTIEHIGHDNSRYGAGPAASGSGASAAAAIRELARVLDDNGRLAVTVPFGRAEDHGWFEQFDEQSWRALVAGSGLDVVEQAVFALGPDGWARVADDDRDARAALTDLGYGTRGPAASAVLCGLLRRA